MLKGKGTKDGREVLILGLSFENMERLKKDRPIVIWREEINIPFDIIIFAGETEESMAKDVAGPNTIINRVPHPGRRQQRH